MFLLQPVFRHTAGFFDALLVALQHNRALGLFNVDLVVRRRASDEQQKTWLIFLVGRGWYNRAIPTTGVNLRRITQQRGTYANPAKSANL